MLEQIILLEVGCIQWLEHITSINWMRAIFGTYNILHQNSSFVVLLFYNIMSKQCNLKKIISFDWWIQIV